MDKVLTFLEKHVEWLVLGLAVAVLAWVAWAFVLDTGIEVTIDGQQLGPAEVAEVAERKGQDLQSKVRSTMSTQFEVPVHKQRFASQVQLADRQLPPVAGVWPSQPIELPEAGGTALPSLQLVDQLPALPPAQLTDVRVGRAYVDKPNENNQPVQVDLNWVKGDFVIDTRQINQAFRTAQIPDGARHTEILRVTFLRQERQSDGTWGEATEVPLLANSAVWPFPGENETDRRYYMEWARSNQAELLTPGFYVIHSGDDPMIKPVEEEETIVVFDPLDRSTWGPVDQLTPEQRRQIQRARAAQREAERGRRQPQQPMEPDPDFPGGMGPGGYPEYPGGDPTYGPDSGYQRRGGNRGYRSITPASTGRTSEIVPFQARGPGSGGGYPPGDPRNYPGGYPGEYPGPHPSEYPDVYPGEYPPGEYPGDFPGGFGPGPQGIQVPRAPSGSFNPGEIEKLEGWVYDDTAESGKTYRYAVRYTIRNPLYKTQGIAQDETLTEAFGIESPITEESWSDPVQVPGLTDFFFASKTPGKEELSFIVYRWQNGKFNEERFRVSPGDPIGTETGGVDYRTGYTLVDIRRDPGTNEEYALLIDRQGNYIKRDDSDRNKEKFKELSNAVASR